MASIFTTNGTLALLQDKVIVFIGDSNIRSLYKDLLWLMNKNTLISNNCLRRRLERTYQGDKLVKSSMLTKSRDFFEERAFQGYHHCLKFYFVTRCYCDIIINYLREVREGASPTPDVIIMNSCLWDITRWGPNGVEEYKDNMVKLMELLTVSLPLKTLFIWTTALPISQTIRGGLMIKQIEFMERSMRFHIMEANLFTSNLVSSYGFDVVDFHYHLQFQISRRSCDGVHYLPLPVRLQTNLILTHIALSWGREIPRYGDLLFIEDEMDLAMRIKTQAQYEEECYNTLATTTSRYSDRLYSFSNPPSKNIQNIRKKSTKSSSSSNKLTQPLPLFPNSARVALPKSKTVASRLLNGKALLDAGCIVREPTPSPLLVLPPEPWQPPAFLWKQDYQFTRPSQFHQASSSFTQSNLEQPSIKHPQSNTVKNQGQGSHNQSQLQMIPGIQFKTHVQKKSQAQKIRKNLPVKKTPQVQVSKQAQNNPQVQIISPLIMMSNQPETSRQFSQPLQQPQAFASMKTPQTKQNQLQPNKISKSKRKRLKRLQRKKLRQNKQKNKLNNANKWQTFVQRLINNLAPRV